MPAAAFLLLTAAPGRCGDIYVAAGDNLQAAIDRAQPGDRLMLAPGATFVGNFRLTNKGASTEFITIRSAAADTLLPPDGVRITPADAVNLPVIKSPNTSPALIASAGAHHWRLQWLEFRANDRGYGDIIALGAGDGKQTLLSQVPHNLVLDRLYIHGDAVIGQKRGVSLHSGATWVVNCYISDIKAVGIDTQAVMGYNGPGPWTVTNNYLEAAGENVLIGGASPKIQNMNASDLEFRGNHMFKPLSWRQPIMATPFGVAAAAGGGGSLPAGTWSYRVVAGRRTAQDAWAFSERSVEVLATTGAGGKVTVSWTAVPHATHYRIYRGSSAGAQDRYFQSTTNSFVDSGSVTGTVGTGLSGLGTKWTVKNIFELKMGVRVLLDGNLLEHSWQQAQTGNAVVLTPRNPENTSPWVAVRDVTISRNIVRHAGGGVVIEGYDNHYPVQQTERVIIRNNLFDDITASAWGGNGRFLQIGSGPRDITADHNTVVHSGHVLFAYGAEIVGFTLTNNLFKHNTYGIMGQGYAYGNDSIAAYLPGSVITRNTLAGGTASRYPAGNEFPTVAAWQAQFVDFAGADYRLQASSPYRGTATDGGDLGADIEAILAAASKAASGHTGEAPPVVSPVSVTTSALPDGWTAQVYQANLQATGGSGVYLWSIASGVLPEGLMLDAATGAITGTPVRSCTELVSVRAADARDGTNSDSKALTLTVNAQAQAVSVAATAATAKEDGAVPGVFTVTRTGDTSAPLTVHYSVSGTAQPGSDYVALPGTVVIAADSASATVTVTPLEDTLDEPEETVTLTVQPDGAYTVDSPASATVTITSHNPQPDFVVASVEGPSSGATGSAITISDTTSNTGAGAGAATVTSFYLSTNIALDAADIWIGSRDVPPLAAGETSSGTTTAYVPAGLPAGNYYLLARADAGDAASESEEGNNVKAGPVVHIGGSEADLVVSTLTVPSTATPGAPMQVGDTTANEGTGPAGASATHFYLSANTLLDAADTLLGTRPVGVLAAGASLAGTTSLVVPAGTEAGSYFLLAVADGAGAVSETVETNNLKVSSSFKVGADLYIAASAAAGTARAGGTLLVSETTANKGTASAPVSVTSFYLSKNSAFDSKDVLLGTREVPKLGPAASHSAETSLTIPAGTAAGTYYVIIRADGPGQVLENNESNNNGWRLVKVGP